MKLLSSLPCTLYASQVSGCCRDIQLTHTTTLCRSSFIRSPLSSPHSSRRLASSSPFRKGFIQRQRRSLFGKNLSTNAAVDVKDPPESRNEKAQELRNNNTTNTNRDQQQHGDASSLSHKVRLLMRRVPHPVAIITASDRRAPSRDGNKKPIFRGMTVSSFNTVTLTPEPVVSFNVRRPSETLNALQSSGRFLVHLLAPSAATAKLARDFSRGNENLQLYQQGRMGEFEFGGIINYGDDGDDHGALPILRRNKKNDHSKETLLAQDSESVIDFPFIFECKYLPQQAIQVYDHTIVLGSVVRVIEPQQQRQQQDKKKEEEESTDFFCLTYADTRFWKMGDQI